jgi:hypothetical protein
MKAAAVTLGLVFAFGAVGALHVFYPQTDPVIPQVLS